MRLHEIHAVDVRRRADQPKNPGDRSTYIGSFQQQAAGTARGRQQSLARLQRLVDPPEGIRTGRGVGLRREDGDVGVHEPKIVPRPHGEACIAMGAMLQRSIIGDNDIPTARLVANVGRGWD